MLHRAHLTALCGLSILVSSCQSCESSAFPEVGSFEQEAPPTRTLRILSDLPAGSLKEEAFDLPLRYVTRQALKESVKRPKLGESIILLASHAGTLVEAANQKPSYLRTLPSEVLLRVPPSLRSPYGRWVGWRVDRPLLVVHPTRIPTFALPRTLLQLEGFAQTHRVAWVPTAASSEAMVHSLLHYHEEEDTQRWLDAMYRHAQAFNSSKEALVAARTNRVDAFLSTHAATHAQTHARAKVPQALTLHPFAEDPQNCAINLSAIGVVSRRNVDRPALRLLQRLLSRKGQSLLATAQQRSPATYFEHCDAALLNPAEVLPHSDALSRILRARKR